MRGSRTGAAHPRAGECRSNAGLRQRSDRTSIWRGYVRAINRGDTEEARYGLRPSKTLRYYAIVSRDSAGALAWRLEELETAAPRRHSADRVRDDS